MGGAAGRDEACGRTEEQEGSEVVAGGCSGQRAVSGLGASHGQQVQALGGTVCETMCEGQGRCYTGDREGCEGVFCGGGKVVRSAGAGESLAGVFGYGAGYPVSAWCVHSQLNWS